MKQPHHQQGEWKGEEGGREGGKEGRRKEEKKKSQEDFCNAYQSRRITFQIS